MIVEKQPWVKTPETLSFFHCTSYDLEKMRSIIVEMDFEDLAWYLKEIVKGRLPEDVEYPKGVSDINRYADKPVILIDAYYDNKIAKEEDVVVYLKSVGVEVTPELNQKALKTLEDSRKKEVELYNYRTGKTDKFPEGVGRKEDFDFLFSVGNEFRKKYEKKIIDHFIKNKE